MRQHTAPAATAVVAGRCLETAAWLRDRLAALRVRLDAWPDRQSVLSAARREAVLAGYDIYRQMLDDVLHEIAAGLGGVDRRSTPPPITADHQDPLTAAHLQEAAEAVAEDLRGLRRELQAYEAVWAGPSAGQLLTRKQEWNAAVDGLLGTAGVLSVFARALGASWLGGGGTTWPDPIPAGRAHPG